MTAVAVTLLSTHPNKQARERKKIILKESRYAKREGGRKRVVIYFQSRFKINSNISRAFFKIYLSFRKYFL